MDVTQLALTWVGWSNGEKLALTWVQIWSRRKWAQCKSSQVNASARKAWPNGVASSPKFSTCVYLRVRLARALLTEREGRTGEYWPEVVTVRTEHREVRTKKTNSQYSPVRLEQVRLVSSLLHGTRLMLYIFSFTRTSGQLKSKDFPARDDASSSESASYHDFEKKFIEHLPNILPA